METGSDIELGLRLFSTAESCRAASWAGFAGHGTMIGAEDDYFPDMPALQ